MKTLHFNSLNPEKLSRKQKEKLAQLSSQPVAGLPPQIFSGVFSATILVSAALLFMVQPMVAKMLLPLLGGVPSVWTTCMLFFQVVLLAGYFYSHVLTSRFNPVTQIKIHGAVLLLAGLFLPIGLNLTSLVHTEMNRILVVLFILTASVGLPFFALAASAPLFQNWFSKTGHLYSFDPYFLYAASNFGSMITLLSYPILIEPVLGLRTQTISWSIGYLILVGLVGAAAYLLLRSQTKEEPNNVVQIRTQNAEESAPSITQKLLWIAAAFVPSSLMLGVTTYFTTDIATIPLLWIIPLTLYLVSFIIVFGKAPQSLYTWSGRLMPIAVVFLLCSMLARGYHDIIATLFYHLGTFSLVALVFHGYIARTRPNAKYLTSFYLWMSFGGMLGGLFNGVIAPNVFKTAAEYPIALVLACVLFPSTKKGSNYPTFSRVLDIIIPLCVGGFAAWLNIKWPLLNWGIEEWARAFGSEPVEFHRALNYVAPAIVCLALLFFKRYVRFGLAVGAFAYAALNMGYGNQDVIHQERSFFGILKVSSDYYDHFRTLMNGTTLHGRQAMVPELRREPLTYYHKLGPVGQIMNEFYGSTRPRHYAAIGLGTGSLAAYGQKDIGMTIYEIDHAVRRIATTYFKFLEDSQSKIDIVTGDARLKLNEAPDESYGVILVDAFSSDSIPVHLLTKEAVQLYFKKVSKDGIVAIHTSNRYLSLEPVLANLAKELSLVMRVNHDKDDMSVGKTASTWVVLTRDEKSLGSLATKDNWIRMEARPSYPNWTDDFTSVLPILR